MTKPDYKKPHIKKFKKDAHFSTAFAISKVLSLIEQLKQTYPTQASKVKVVDVHLTSMYGHDNQKIVVKYIFVDKPAKGIQEISIDEFTMQSIIDRYLSK